jgi:hypothetical protein
LQIEVVDEKSAKDLDSVYVDSKGTIVVVDSEGGQEEIKPTKGKGTRVTDKDGDQWVVDKDGKVSKVPPSGGVSSSQPKPVDVGKLDDFDKLVKKALDTLVIIGKNKSDSLTKVFSSNLEKLKETINKAGYDEFLFSGPEDILFKVGMSKLVKPLSQEKIKKANEIDKGILSIYYNDVAIQDELKIINQIKENLTEAKFKAFRKEIETGVDKQGFEKLNSAEKIKQLMTQSIKNIKQQISK